MHLPSFPRRAPEDAVSSAGSVARAASTPFVAPAAAGAPPGVAVPPDVAGPFSGPGAAASPDPAFDPIAETRIGQLLRQAGNMTAENIERVARTQQELGLRFGEAAMRLGLVNQDDIDAAIARQFAYPLAPRGASTLSPRLVGSVLVEA